MQLSEVKLSDYEKARWKEFQQSEYFPVVIKKLERRQYDAIVDGANGSLSNEEVRAIIFQVQDTISEFQYEAKPIAETYNQ